jgi:hypothetical protein
MAVTEARHRRAAACVEVAPPVGVDDVHARSADGDRRRAMEVAVEDVGHEKGKGGDGRQEMRDGRSTSGHGPGHGRCVGIGVPTLIVHR